MSTETSAPVNSREYWDRRFSADWKTLGGPDQSRTFMDLLIKFLPAAVYEEIAAEGLSILDCGCATGDGTAVLAAEFPNSRVGGFDFSATAIQAARQAYPALELSVGDFATLDRRADVLVASHCLEHLASPMSALRRLAAQSDRYFLVLTPFLESYPPHREHRRVVHASTFPLAVDGWSAIHRIVLPPVSHWRGNQLLLLYRSGIAPERVSLPPLPSVLDVDQQMGMHRLGGELREVREALAAWTGRLEEIEAGREEMANREERIRQLESDLREGSAYVQALQEERESTVRELTARLAAAEREREELRVESESWRWDAASARRELSHLQTSRLWRAAHVYWELRRRLGILRGPGTPAAEGSAGVPSRASSSTSSTSPPNAALPPALPRVPARRYDVLVFSIIDWDFRFQRPQQIATQFGRHGHRVFYLSTTRFLPPGGPPWALAWKAQNVVELALRSRRALDVYGGRLEEPDVDALEECLGDLLRELAAGDVISLVQIPFWAPLADRLRERYGWRVVYDCMDEWSNFPGFGEAVLAREEGLVRGADLTVATARRLREKLDGQARRLALVRNGVDLDHYRRHYGENPLLGEVAHPVIGYYGALASWVDVDLLEKIARRFPAATLVLAGGVFDLDLSRIESLPNVRLLGQRPYEEMPRLLWHFDACVIPFLVNDITEATNPVKFYEYLSAGKPVVAPRLTELEPYEDLCYLAAGHEDFLAQLESALAEPAGDPRRERRRTMAAANDWKERYAGMAAAVAETFPLVSVIVVTHGGLPLTRRCVESLLEGETWPRFEVLVVDNASPDGTREYLGSLSDPRLRVLLQERNLGFPAANNVGLREARGEVVLLLNNDTVVPPGMIGRLVRPLLRDRGVGLVCATTNFCGNEARVEPGYEDLAGLPGFAAARAREHAGRLLDLPVAAMYCVAARREVIDEIGPLDEAFGIGMFEDDDYSLRARQAGYRVVCAEEAYVHHVGQGSFRALSPQEYETLWRRNQGHYERKWGRPWKPHAMRPGVAPVPSKVGLA